MFSLSVSSCCYLMPKFPPTANTDLTVGRAANRRSSGDESKMVNKKFMHGMGLHDRNAFTKDFPTFDEPILFRMFNLFQMAHFILPQGRVQGSANLRGPGSEKMRIKKLRSFACSRQENAIFSPHIHRTWETCFSPSLYRIRLTRARG